MLRRTRKRGSSSQWIAAVELDGKFVGSLEWGAENAAAALRIGGGCCRSAITTRDYRDEDDEQHYGDAHAASQHGLAGARLHVRHLAVLRGHACSDDRAAGCHPSSSPLFAT